MLSKEAIGRNSAHPREAQREGSVSTVPYAKVLRIAGLTVLGLLLALYVGLPVAMAAAAVWPTRADVGPPPDGFTEASPVTSDGVRLAAWYAPPRNGAAVILVHGAGGSREDSRRLAATLRDRGYGVLSLDLRGHGQSEGRTNRLGWQGTRDIRAAVDFIRTRNADVSLGAVGLSMGGEVVLGASASCPEMRAIVADGATRRCTEELLALPSKRSLAESFTPRVMYAAVRLMSGERPPTPLLGEMVRAEAADFLLIAAGNNELEVAFNERFSRTLGKRASVWVAPDVSHLGAYSRYPDEYERRVLGFLDRTMVAN